MPPLPAPWVDRVFARMAVRYGAAWLRMWEGIDMAAVRADWCNQLAGLQNRPEALRYGLDNLPLDRPPTAGQFAALCSRAPVAAPLALPAPPVDPEGVARVRAAVAGIRPTGPMLDHWQRTQERIDSGEIRPTITQRDMVAAGLAHCVRGAE